MKNYFFKILFSVFVLLFFSQFIHAQFSNKKLDLSDKNQKHVLVLKTGERIKGSITKIQNENLFIQPSKTDSVFQFQLSEIKRIRVRDNLIELQKHFDSSLPPTLSLFFTNTAFAMKKDEVSYRTFWGNSLMFSKQFSKGAEAGIGYSFPFFIHTFFKTTGKTAKGKSRHGAKLAVALSPITIFDSEQIVVVSELSQLNTFGNENKFFNLTFNYYEISAQRFDFDGIFLKRYFGVAFGGGVRLGEDLQFHINQNLNFNSNFIDVDLVPSFGVNWTFKEHNIAFGYMSSNDIGFNFFPIFETEFDRFITLEKSFLSKLPFFSYSRIF